MRSACALVLCGLLQVSLAVAAPMPEPAARITIQLNDMQPAEGGCRAVFVAHNGLAKAIDRLNLRVVGFDGKGRAAWFLSLDIGALPIEKTRVLRFDLGKGVVCAEVSRLLLDDVTECAGGDLAPADCLAAISTSSRGEVPFDL